MSRLNASSSSPTSSPTSPVPASFHSPLISYSIYHRVSSRKFPILPLSPHNNSPSYYILAPPAWRMKQTKNGKSANLGHKEWLSVLYHSSNNPKYTSYPESRIIGHITRGNWWKKIDIVVGGEAPKEVEEIREKVERKRLKTKNFWRKLACKAPKELEFNEVEEVSVGAGVKREAGMRWMKHRRYEIEVEGVEYLVKATRGFKKAKWRRRGLKGFVLDYKMIRKLDGVVVATLERTGKGGVKGDKTLGKQWAVVRIFERLYSCYEQEEVPEHGDAVVIQILWAMAFAEKKKRETIVEILQEIAENAGG